MKKAKMFLSAIVVFAVVGGALAFKTNYSGALFCNTIQQGPGPCQDLLTRYALDRRGTAMYCSSGLPGEDCVNLVKVVANP